MVGAKNYLILLVVLCFFTASAQVQKVDQILKMPNSLAKLDLTISQLQNPFVANTNELSKLIDNQLDYVKTSKLLKIKMLLAVANFYFNQGDELSAKQNLKIAENQLLGIKEKEKTELLVQVAKLNAQLGNNKLAKDYLQNLEIKSRGEISAYVLINNLLLQANVYALLKDNKNKSEVLSKADDIATDLRVDIDESEANHILCQLIINSIRLGRFSKLDLYYNQLLLKQNNSNEQEFQQAVAMYQDFKKQYVNAERNYKKLTSAYLQGNRTEYGFEAIVRLADLYSRKLSVDSAQRYFKLAKENLNPNISTQPLGLLYTQLYQNHLQRISKNKGLITSVSKTLKQRDSTYKLELEASLKEANYKYSLLTNKQQIKLLTQQKELATLNELKAKQRNYLITLSLALLALVACTVSYVFYQKRKRSLLQFNIEKERTAHIHHLEMNKMLATSQEEERTRIAEKLHDEIGSMLAVVRLNLSSPSNNDTVVLPNGQLQTASKVLADVADTVREMSHELMPIALNKLGLKKAIEQMIWDINASKKINIESVIMGMEKGENIFTYDFQVNIYRIIQELFQNILKHANAKHVLFQLLIRADELNIMIEDNGIGMDANAEITGRGMKLIDARLNNYNGKLSVDSRLGKGTLIIIDIPIRDIMVS